MSDDVLNGDLLRFYDNPDFDKVKPSNYKYETGPQGQEKNNLALIHYLKWIRAFIYKCIEWYFMMRMMIVLNYLI